MVRVQLVLQFSCTNMTVGRSSEIVMLDTYPPDNYLDDFVSASSLFFSSNDSVLL
jgi:hypothetical protein